jgi:hypothetical protein
MTEVGKYLHCRIHGPSPTAFVCQHLASGKSGIGFFCAEELTEPDDPRPDTWCAAVKPCCYRRENGMTLQRDLPV